MRNGIENAEYFLKKHLKVPFLKAFCGLGRYLSASCDRPLDKAGISRILVAQGGGIGDIIRAFPLLEPLHEAFPSATIDFLGPFGADFFRMYKRPGIIREVLLFDVAVRHRTLPAKLRLISDLRRRKYDLTVCTQTGVGMIEFALLSFLIGSPYRLGYEKDGAGFLFTGKIPLRTDRSLYGQNVELLRSAGISCEHDVRCIVIPEEERVFARSFLESAGVLPGEKVVAVSPVVLADRGRKSPQHKTSLAEPRNWPEDRFVALIDRLSGEIGVKVLVLGDRLPDGALARRMETGGWTGAISAIGKTTILQAAALVGESAMLVSNDSGLLHVAAGLGKPCVGLFGSTSPVQQLGFREGRGTAIWKAMDCSPCYAQEPVPRFQCGRDYRCLKEISVDEVVECVVTLLRPSP